MSEREATTLKKKLGKVASGIGTVVNRTLTACGVIAIAGGVGVMFSARVFGGADVDGAEKALLSKGFKGGDVSATGNVSVAECEKAVGSDDWANSPYHRTRFNNAVLNGVAESGIVCQRVKWMSSKPEVFIERDETVKVLRPVSALKLE